VNGSSRIDQEISRRDGKAQHRALAATHAQPEMPDTHIVIQTSLMTHEQMAHAW